MLYRGEAEQLKKRLERLWVGWYCVVYAWTGSCVSALQVYRRRPEWDFRQFGTFRPVQCRIRNFSCTFTVAWKMKFVFFCSCFVFLSVWTPYGLLDGGLTIDYESLYAIPYVHTVGEIAQALPIAFQWRMDIRSIHF